MIEILSGEFFASDVADLFARANRFYDELYPAESNHLVGAEVFDRPDALFLTAREQGQLLGTAGYILYTGYAEIKRLYVDRQARGQGIAIKLLGVLEHQAIAHGINCLRLEVGIRQPEAINLYHRLGYTDTGPFGDYAEDPLSVFMVKELGLR
jgi:putative acetyltransferase